jgi:hypothetical protein
MSRYQWPGTRRSGDRPMERADHNAFSNGLIVDSAPPLVARLTPFDAPAGSPNLWVPIGPSTVLNGQGSDHPRVSGRVRDIAVSDDGQRAYAATANGGVWYTSDGGNAWSPLGNWLPTPDAGSINLASSDLTCGCLLVSFGAAADGSNDDVYVGTGELITRTEGGTQQGGVGVLHLSDPLPTALADPFGVHWKREAKNLAGWGIYRLARDPNDANTLVAATSIGLFTRTGPFVEDADWTRVTTAPFNFDISDRKFTTDVLWTNPAGGSQLFVALMAGSDTAVWTSTGGTGGTFTNVSLPSVALRNFPYGRLGFAVAPSDPTTVYVLGTGPRLWRINGVTPTAVSDLPNALFGTTSDQSNYDLAIAVDPDNSNVVIVGGSTVKGDNGEWCASLFKLTVAAAGGGLSAGFVAANQNSPGADPSFIGNAVHADVHQVRMVKAGGATHVWVCCDGGVYRSASGGAAYAFLPRGSGIAALETDYISCHPANDAFVIAGAQDNGLLMRVGNTVWMHSDPIGGDAGGTLFHPVKSKYFAAQYTNADWNSNGHLSEPVLRGTGGNSESNENRHAFFYSSGDIRQIGATQVRLAIGTNRVWLADNWDPEAATTAWITLPGRNDPRAGSGTDEGTDVYGEGTGRISACRWMDDNRLIALVRAYRADGKDTAVLLYKRNPDGSWTRSSLSEHSNKKSDYGNSDIPQPSSNYLPPLGQWNDIAINDPSRGTNGSFYVATTGFVKLDGNNLVEADRMDTLWWYDGSSTWYPTTLRSAATGTKAPAYAVACDPSDLTKVYVGTGLGVWAGVLDLGGASPAWQWQKLSNGLPYAAVQDLVFYSRGPLKLLRTALQARGLWELDLSATPVTTQQILLRVHANDARRASVTDLTNPMLTGPAANWPWSASPDIRVRPAPLGAGESIPTPPSSSSLPWAGGAASGYWLWVFQTALHRIDPLCRPNGRWTNQFAARLRALDATLSNSINVARWNSTVTPANVFAPPWDGTEPSEADLYELVVDDPVTTGPTDSVKVRRRRYKVDVQVHYRDVRPLDAANVSVSLLRFVLPPALANWPAVPITDAWKTAVQTLMTGGTPAFPTGWTAADAGTPVRSLNSAIDARTPRTATFEVSFAANTANQNIALVAIVHATVDPLTAAGLTGGTLRDLVLNNRQVSLRTVRVIRDTV